MPLSPGERLGPYAIEAPLGAGGMGEVYRAKDTRLDRTVAIKVLQADLAQDETLRTRFEREARAISSLEHPHICALYDVGEQDGRAYLVMQYLEGRTLSERLEKGPLPAEHALRIAIEVCSALDSAHRQGVIHRDVKPSNIMLTSSGAKLLDFGLAAQRPAVIMAPGASATARSARLTEEGTILGTLHYMAPEQIRGEEADARSDLHALGAVLFEMFSGQPPFTGSDPASLIGAILMKAPPPLVIPEGPSSRIERAIRVCLEKEPIDRWQSARDLLRELQWIAEERSGGGVSPELGVMATRRPAPSTRRLLLAIAATALVTTSLGWATWGRPSTPPLPKSPVIVMMDSPHPQRVYDPATLRAGGTNADDLTDLLSDLPVSLIKETTGSVWHRDEQVVGQDPDLILVHRSCFYDATLLGDSLLDRKYAPQIYPWAADKFESFMGYIALANPRTRFVVYSRGSWATDSAAQAWIETVVRRFPRLAGRVSVYKVPLDRATFRNAETAAEIRALALASLRDMGRSATPTP